MRLELKIGNVTRAQESVIVNGELLVEFVINVEMVLGVFLRVVHCVDVLMVEPLVDHQQLVIRFTYTIIKNILLLIL